MQANNIDEVLGFLRVIIARCREEQSTDGYFAALYQQVTAQVKKGIDTGLFDDGPRMERLDVIFANRYFAALDAWREDQPTSKSWRVAFKNGGDRLLILQHLLLAMNAHINLDLGIAAAVVAPGPKIQGLKDDFDRINKILGKLIDPAENVVGRFSPLLGILDEIGGRTEERLIGFSMDLARDEAWEHAVLFSGLNGDQLDRAIAIVDKKIAFLGKTIADPGALLAMGLKVIRAVESDDVVATIDALAAIQSNP